METGIIQSDVRDTMRNIKKAMQGNVVRALVELITNSDDSYIRLGEQNSPSGVCGIDILYEKCGYDCVLGVRDFAEGMSIDDIRQGFKHYGAATSGLIKGKRVRGYFGHGAKDALAGMEDGRICAFKNDEFVECRIFIKDHKPIYEIDDPKKITPDLRNKHGMPGNGTIAYFKASYKKVTVPQLDTVHEELANNFLLRKIMANRKRRICLIDVNSGQKRILRYRLPDGKIILDAKFEIENDGLGNFPISLIVSRAEKGELTQLGDNRSGGLLLLDEEQVVLGISLFKYNNEPLAARFFGELIIGNFRKLLEKEEAVLSDDRNGLLDRHPFCEKLIREIEQRLGEKVREESLRKQKEQESKIVGEELQRYRKAFSFINEIAEQEAQEATNLGSDPDTVVDVPRNGICFFPDFAQITVGKRYNLELRIDPTAIRKDEPIQISCLNNRIKIQTAEVRLLPGECNKRVVKKYISLEGKEPNVEGLLTAKVGKQTCQARIQVMPEKDLLLSEGMVFQPETITVRPNEPRRVYLCVYVKMIENGSKIKLSSDNENIQISLNEIIVRETDAVRSIAKYEVQIWGEQEGESAMVSAEYESYMAILGVHVKSREPEADKGRKGMFSEPEFNFDHEPIQRTSYSSETGKIIVYVNFPSTKHYLGEDREYARTLAAQVLIADLVAERCFYEIAKKKAESSGALTPEALPDRIRNYEFGLSKKYGKKIHERLVDQEQLQKSKSQIRAETKP